MNKKLYTDSLDYQKKKALFNQMLTIYGRNSVLEALQANLDIYRVHLADSNKPAVVLDKITQLAESKNIDIVYHSKQGLSRISRNSKQDQGVAADVMCLNHQTLDNWLEQKNQSLMRVLALDSIHNPQNLGMIIRSATASGINGILISSQGNAKLGPLVIKASAGSLFKAPIVHCENLAQGLSKLKEKQFDIISMKSQANQSIVDFIPAKSCCYVLGNESEGVSHAVEKLCNVQLSLPMQNNIESLNVAVSAALISYIHIFQK